MSSGPAETGVALAMWVSSADRLCSGFSGRIPEASGATGTTGAAEALEALEVREALGASEASAPPLAMSISAASIRAAPGPRNGVIRAERSSLTLSVL